MKENEGIVVLDAGSEDEAVVGPLTYCCTGAFGIFF